MKYYTDCIGTSHASVVVYDHRLIPTILKENLALQLLIHYGKTTGSTWVFLALAMALLLAHFDFFYYALRLCFFNAFF